MAYIIGFYIAAMFMAVLGWICVWALGKFS